MIVSVCMGLVTVEEERGIIRLLHHTTLEYLQTNMDCLSSLEGPTTLEDPTIFDIKENKIAKINAQRDITTICVTYLSFSIFESGFCQTDNEFEERMHSNQFYDYATRNWGHHACKASSLSQEVMDFLECKAKVEASSQALIAVKRYPWNSDYSQLVPRQMTGLH